MTTFSINEYTADAVELHLSNEYNIMLHAYFVASNQTIGYAVVFNERHILVDKNDVRPIYDLCQQLGIWIEHSEDNDEFLRLAGQIRTFTFPCYLTHIYKFGDNTAFIRLDSQSQQTFFDVSGADCTRYLSKECLDDYRRAIEDRRWRIISYNEAQHIIGSRPINYEYGFYKNDKRHRRETFAQCPECGEWVYSGYPMCTCGKIIVLLSNNIRCNSELDYKAWEVDICEE